MLVVRLIPEIISTQPEREQIKTFRFNFNPRTLRKETDLYSFPYSSVVFSGYL